jgi:glycosyltransferase involved in cell wall biosynthesis
LRITWASNAPWAPTGYGTQTAQMLPRLLADGHDVIVAANYGLQGTTLPDPVTGTPVFGLGADTYGRDIMASIHGERDWLITLYDVWVYNGFLADIPRVASWTPVDHFPVSPEVARWAREHTTIAMSQFGRDSLIKAGIKAHYAPHGIEEVWRPTLLEGKDPRIGWAIPDDAFLVIINAANKGKMPLPRKAWYEMLAASSVFLQERPDAYLYIHADLSGVHDGLPLPLIMEAVGMPGDRVRFADQMAYTAGRYTSEMLAAFYTSADVLLSTSMGEGFGLAVIEAQACGTPVIVTDFSAQPELVGAGWKVPFSPIWDYTQASHLALPSISRIKAALEEARDAKGDPTLRSMALAKAAEYAADKVYAEHWRPILSELEADLRPKSRQHRRRNARKAA